MGASDHDDTHPLGSSAAQLLATEHWSLLAARTLIWNQAMAAAIAVLVLQPVGAATAAMVAGGVVGFLAVWGGLMPLQRHTADPLRRGRPRFPTPPKAP